MAKVDLGLVGVFPWTDTSELYTFPTSSNFTSSGGYKVKDGICFIDVVISCSGSASVTLPAIKTDGVNHANVYTNATGIKLALYETGDGTCLASNVLQLKGGDYVNIYGCYETTAEDT